MKLSQLHYFLEACRQENITKAAKTLHISQPSLTIAIQDLENELGVKLFNRVNQRIHMTQEGHYFYEKLTPILTDLRSLTERVKEMGTKKDLIKIGIPPMMGSFLFPELFQKLNEYNPAIRLQISEYGAIHMQKLLLDEELDLSMIIKESFSSEKIVFRHMSTCQVKLCVSASHPLAAKEEVSIEELKEEPLIVFGAGFYVTQLMHSLFEKANAKPNIILETSQISTMKNVISNGFASAFLLDRCIMPEDVGIEVVDIKDLAPINIGLAWKKDRFISGNTVKMIDYIIGS